MTRSLYPPRLRPGQCVAVFAPSAPLAAHFPARFQRGIDALAQALNVNVVVPAQATARTGFTSGSARERATALEALLNDPNIHAIFCTVGGFNSAEILPLLDQELVRCNPKVFVGYSDSSSLLLGLHAIGGWVTFHGPAVLSQFGEYPRPFEFTLRALSNAIVAGEQIDELADPHEWTDEFLDWGSEEWTRRPRHTYGPAERTVWAHGHGTGTLFGGNIETINLLVGTPYFQPPREMVFFWEATREEARLPRIRRALIHLRQSGMFSSTRAMLIGRSPHCKAEAGSTLRDVVEEVVGDMAFPVIANLAFGHTDPVLTLPIGVTAIVDAPHDSPAVIRIRIAQNASPADERLWSPT